MQATFLLIRKTLALVLVLSSLVLVQVRTTQAHEVNPTVGDIALEDGRLTLGLRITLESFLAGIDLDTAEDTNDVPQADDYDALRALEPAELEDRLRSSASTLLSGIGISTDGTPRQWSIESVDIPPVDNLELPRLSQLVLAAEAPAGTRSFKLDWPSGYGSLILRQMGAENAYTGYLTGGQSSPDIAVVGGEARTAMGAFAEYIPIGFDHILPKGLDHILFVLGLFFFSTALRPLLLQVTAFTLAHTVTLALGAAGWVTVPGSIVEPLIAASIVFVAVENVFAKTLHAWRPAVIFMFGLLHGLGFASVLGEFGLPQDQFVAALIGFNVGVEFGQLTVIALAFLAVGYWFGGKPWYKARIASPISLIIAAVGAYWFVERVFL